MSTLTFSPEAKEQFTTSEEKLLNAIFTKRDPILQDEDYFGDKRIIFRDLLTNELYRLEARELSFRHLEEIVKNTIKVEENGDYLVAYLRQLYPDKQFTFSLYGDNAKHIVCELQAERLGTCIVGITKSDGSTDYLLARQLPLGFEEALINGDMNFYGSKKSYIDYVDFLLKLLCSKKNLNSTVEPAATTDCEESPVPTKEEIFNKRTQPVICRNTDKIFEVFPMVYDDGEYINPLTVYRKPAPTIDLTKLERKPCEMVRFFWTGGARFFRRHPLDLLREELIELYLGRIVIIDNEEAFYKYETLIRIAHGMQP
ncbi:MAG: hypothetical protein IJ045_03425 [Ruminiclostridium sp.]|nr:hypothetical protein [Ruminiclostridium sp.]